MPRVRLSPSAYQRVTFVALVLLALIVVSGAAVRLTGSGLGCSDWPTCEEGRLAPAEIDDAPAMIEFVNRTITGLVSVAVIVAVLGALVRVPRRRDLTWLAAGLVAGVVAQIVLGGMVVLFDLSPRLVMGHFILSMLIVWNAVVLHHRAGQPDPLPEPATRGRQIRLSRVAGSVAAGRMIVVAAGLVVFTGTVVTASGPHAGDEIAERLDFAVADVARVHGLSVMVLALLTIVLLVGLRREGSPVAPARDLLLVLAAQAGVGYAQYFTGVPALLVGIHVVGALAVWVAATLVPLRMTRAPVAQQPVEELVPA